MSIFYSNSLKPRGFEYLNHKSGTPIELQGHLKRHNSVRGFLRSDEANETHIQRNQSRTRNAPDSKRTMIPDYNVTLFLEVNSSFITLFCRRKTQRYILSRSQIMTIHLALAILQISSIKQVMIPINLKISEGLKLLMYQENPNNKISPTKDALKQYHLKRIKIY